MYARENFFSKIIAGVVGIFNFFSTVIFIILTINTLKNAKPNTLLYFVTLGFAGIYAVMFLVTIIMLLLSRGRRRKEAMHEVSVVAKGFRVTRKIMLRVTIVLNLLVSVLFTMQNWKGGGATAVLSFFAVALAITINIYYIIRKSKKLKKIAGDAIRRKKLQKENRNQN